GRRFNQVGLHPEWLPLRLLAAAIVIEDAVSANEVGGGLCMMDQSGFQSAVVAALPVAESLRHWQVRHDPGAPILRVGIEPGQSRNNRGDARLLALEGLGVAVMIGTAAGRLADEDSEGFTLEPVGEVLRRRKCYRTDEDVKSARPVEAAGFQPLAQRLAP